MSEDVMGDEGATETWSPPMQQGCHDIVLDGYEMSEDVMGDEGATETWSPLMPTRLP